MGRTSGFEVRGGAGRGSGQLRVWIFVAVPVAVVVLLAYAVAFAIDEPLRWYTEAKVNRALKGYTVRINALDFHPHNLSLDLKGLTITQNDHPDPPVMHIPFLRASVHWRALVHGRVVGDMFLDRPEVHMNVVQLRKEIADPTPIEQRAWQEALEAVFQTAPSSQCRCRGYQHPERPFAGPHVPFRIPSDGDGLRFGPRHGGGPGGFSRRAEFDLHRECRPRANRARLLQARDETLQRVREQRPALRPRTVRIGVADPAHRLDMLYYAPLFLLVGLLAGALGLFGVAAVASQIAWILFLVGIILLVVHLVIGRGARIP